MDVYVFLKKKIGVSILKWCDWAFWFECFFPLEFGKKKKGLVKPIHILEPQSYGKLLRWKPNEIDSYSWDILGKLEPC